MKHTLVGTLGLALGFAAASEAAWGDCAARADREATVDMAGAAHIRIDAGPGSLHVNGRAGARVRAHGTACASTDSLLEGIRLVAERRGDTVYVEAVVPEHGMGWKSYAYLDLVVEVPERTALEVEDASGDTIIENVGATKVTDSSGDLRIAGVRGDLAVRDGSGDLDISDVDGTIRLRDGSGQIRVRDAGSVVVESDSSGDIDIANVRGDVSILDDGSGGIEVAGVGGNFTVEDDGSGGIHHSGVKGQVRIPSRH